MMPTENMPANPKQDLRAIRILFIALVTGIVIFNVIIIAFIQFAGPSMETAETSSKNIFMYAAFIIAAIALLSAVNLYKKRIGQIKTNSDLLNDKLNQYRAALILYLALCEGPALFAVICLFLTGNYLLLIISAIMLLAMFAKAPSLKSVVDELGLDWNQQQELE